MNQFRPHLNPQPRFEGYYSKFDLPSGARLALVICSVPQAETRPHMVSFTYVPPGFPDIEYFQREIWVDDIQMLDRPGKSTNTATYSITAKEKGLSIETVAFQLVIPRVGSLTVHEDNSTIYDIKDPNGSFEFYAHVPGGEGVRVPWCRGQPKSTPEGMLVYLPLPLHWHVHTLGSRCKFKLSITKSLYQHLHSDDVSQRDSNLTATVHQEKNWAHSFPSSHIWIQARNDHTKTGINIAGGSIIGTEAYLISYHAANPLHDISFTPPFAMAPAIAPTFSPSMSIQHSWAERHVELTVSSLMTKIEIAAKAPRDTFVGLSAPFGDGHRLNFLGQSFRTMIEVKVFHASRGGFGHWVEVCREVFENGSLEFGGDAYGEAGSKRRVN